MMLRQAEILLTVMLLVETGLGEVFIPAAPSGTFYAETYDGGDQCYSTTRTPVTLTLHPPLAIAAPSVDQSCMCWW